MEPPPPLTGDPPPPQNSTAESKAAPTGPWSFWQTLGLGLLVMGGLILGQIVVGVFFGVVLMMRHRGSGMGLEQIGESLSSNPLMLAVATFVSAPVVGALLWLLIFLRRGPGLLDYLGLRGFRISQFFLWLSGLAAVLIGGELLLRWSGDRSGQSFMLELMAQKDYLPVLSVAIVLVAPLVEEVLFRGFMYRGMAGHRRFPWLALLVPNVLWTLLHVQYQPATMGVLFLMGIVFGCARHFSGSTMLPVLLHMLSNALATVSTFLALQEQVGAP